MKSEDILVPVTIQNQSEAGNYVCTQVKQSTYLHESRPVQSWNNAMNQVKNTLRVVDLVS